MQRRQAHLRRSTSRESHQGALHEKPHGRVELLPGISSKLRTGPVVSESGAPQPGGPPFRTTTGPGVRNSPPGMSGCSPAEAAFTLKDEKSCRSQRSYTPHSKIHSGSAEICGSGQAEKTLMSSKAT